MKDNQSQLAQEWQLLQNQFDSYEKWSLVIKLFAVGVFAMALMQLLFSPYSIMLFAILWLQDGIWKTFQSRIEVRLLAIESAIEKGSDINACQFNAQFLLSRPGTLGLVLAYVKSALKPTVAFPHIVLVVLSVIIYCQSML